MEHKNRAITTEDLLKFSMYSDPQISPVADSFVFVSTRINDQKTYESHLWMKHLDESEEKQWTFHHKKDSHPRFSPDGRKIAFQSTRSGKSQIWLIPTKGGEAKQITHFQHGASTPHWSKDGKFIIFTALLKKDIETEQNEEGDKNEEEKQRKKPFVIDRLKYKSDAHGLHTDDLYQQIILYDVEHETFKQLTKGAHDYSFQDISPCGSTILFTANLGENTDYEQTNDIYELHIVSGEMTKLTKRSGAYSNATYSPDGTYIVCFGHEFEYYGATLPNLWLFDRTLGKWDCLSENWDILLGDGMIGDMRMGSNTIGPVWDGQGERLFFIGTYFGATGLYEVNLYGERKTLYEQNNHLFSFAYDEQKDYFILGISSPTEQGNFYLLEGDQKEITKLTNANPFLNEIALSEPEEFTITAKDGWNIQGWLMKPYNFEKGKKYPCILEIHGGPHAMYGQTFFHEMQVLAAKGYVVLYTNPRGSHGYGQAFVNAVRGDYGGSDYTDLMTAVDDALRNYSFIDENRLGVTGGSYGGFMTNWIVSHTNRFKAAVTQRSISNWLSFYGVSDIGYFFTKWELGKELMEDPKTLWEFSPLKYAKNIETPLLILHGEFDYRCPIEQAEQLFITLKHLKKEVQFVRFPDANHELSRSGDPFLRIERLQHICTWFDKYL